MRLPLKDRVVVLTGAASGIGAALARSLAKEGAALALVDVDGEGLEHVAAGLPTPKCPVKSFVLDVTSQSAVGALPNTVAASLGPAAVLINNAGVALGGRFDQVTAEQFNRVMEVNFASAVNLTRAFLPQLRGSAPAQLVNVSSLFGIVGMPGNTAYCASKFALRGFSEALRTELVGSGVGITVVHPGGVRTNIAKKADVGPGVTSTERDSLRVTGEKFLRKSPDAVGQHIVRAMIHRRKRVVIGADAHLLTFLQRVLPASYSAFYPKR